MKNLDELHSLVSDAIWRAEQAEERGPGSAAGEWAAVSSLEERLAVVIPVSASEGRIARRGAVRAAFKAGDHARGRSLAERYLAEEGVPASLKETLQQILDEDTRAAARPHKPAEPMTLSRLRLNARQRKSRARES